MKKKISFIVALSLILSMVSIHATTVPDSVNNQSLSGRILQELNIIKGTQNGLEENGSLNREQSIVILIRMLGLEQEAQAFTAYGQFSDLPKNHWAAKYVDYAYTKGLTNGIGNNLFGTGQPVNRKIMATYMLRALNHSADWSKEDIMGKARTIGITLDAGDGSEKITRGQAFIYMINSLEIPKNGNSGLILGEQDLHRFKEIFEQTRFDYQSNPVADKPKTDVQIQAPKVFTSVQLPQVLKPVAAKTYLYDELDIKFNTLVSFPSKNNFTFTVDGRRIEDAHYNLSPGGDSIRFKFSNQNLHGKTIVCAINGLKASDGKSAISDAVITAEFKDFIPIKFVQAEVLDQKSFRGLMSINVMPPDGHRKGTEGHEVYSDGRLMQENVDYRLGWGGKEFKVVFTRPEVYPKQEASLKVWGYMTAPYHKFMDDADQIELDFTIFEKKEIPLPEVREPKPAEIVVEPPKLHPVEVWKEVEVSERPKREDSPSPSRKYGDVKRDAYIKIQPIVIIEQNYNEYRIVLYTDGKVGSVEGLRLLDKNGKEIEVSYQPFEKNLDGNQYYGFEITPEGAKEKRDFGGYEVFVEKLYEKSNQVYTGPFSIRINQIIN